MGIDGRSEFSVFLILIGSIIPNGNAAWDFNRLGTLNEHNFSYSDFIIGKQTSGYDLTYYASLHWKGCKLRAQRPNSDQFFFLMQLKKMFINS